MKSTEERLWTLEQTMAKLQEEEVLDREFKEEIKKTIQQFINRNMKVDEFIEKEIETRREKAEFWKNQREKLATASILSAIGLLGSTLWYAVSHFIHSGGK